MAHILAAQAHAELPRHPPTLNPAHQSQPRRRTAQESDHWQDVPTLQWAVTPGKGTAAGVSGSAQEDRGKRWGRGRDADKSQASRTARQSASSAHRKDGA